MAYSVPKSVAEKEKENWVSALSDLPCAKSFAFAWWNRSVGDNTRFATEFQQRL